MDLDLIERELLGAAAELFAEHPNIKSIVLECTDLPPYASKLQLKLKLPVFDITTLACMVHNVVDHTPYTGLMPY